MMVTIKSKDGYDVDITRLYMQAMEKSITIENYKSQLDVITKTLTVNK